jgi:hypothetical protein
MGPFVAVDAFVPLWIFAPLLLIGVVGWIITPNPRSTSQDREWTTGRDPGLRTMDSGLARR